MKQFGNSIWLDVDEIMLVQIKYKKEFSATGLAVEVETDNPSVVAIAFKNGVAVNLEGHEAQTFYDWWKQVEVVHE